MVWLSVTLSRKQDSILLRCEQEAIVGRLIAASNGASVKNLSFPFAGFDGVFNRFPVHRLPNTHSWRWTWGRSCCEQVFLFHISAHNFFLGTICKRIEMEDLFGGERDVVDLPFLNLCWIAIEAASRTWMIGSFSFARTRLSFPLSGFLAKKNLSSTSWKRLPNVRCRGQDEGYVDSRSDPRHTG